ncbi:filamentous hemagglutinin family protein [Bradyrhizobium sp. Arg237L]|uniref:filamentous haemagglutinin family protein n=1 Tax=Bradyrhizobium sp. Arg237L TaxID=3003352 RepID=UPI00249DFABC|nr:filamentous haemagglutinin family protein [Bradyrhizobium sp. Arg237L]MDI4236711.1 filamentous hemagglutinin family protein [Bradyrhizobium sp. Arg237L]
MTQFGGDIQMYSRDSILLGLSRIMTNFGDDIFAWSAEGDINAGRGSKTTIGYTPPRRVYDDYGHISLSPSVPKSGAGISARSAIPGVDDGDIDLHAPLGTIDVGEAGIAGRNINVSALQIINAANISARGNVTGVPTIQAPNIGGLTEASNTAGAGQQVAKPTRTESGERPSIIIVEFLGFGGGDGETESGPSGDKRARRSSLDSYDPNSAVHMLGNGRLSEEQKRRLTEEERDRLNALAAQSGSL